MKAWRSMKKIVVALMLTLAAPSYAMPTFGIAPIYRGDFARHQILLAQAPTGTVAPASDPVTILAQAQADLPAGKWAGKLDLTKDFALGGWQSLKSADEAYGISKPVWSLLKGGQPILNVGLFAGIDKPLVPLASSSPKFLGGLTVAVPGSTLDWALGTNMGAQWVPALKTGLLCAYDVSRPKALKAVPDFVGIGASYGFTLK